MLVLCWVPGGAGALERAWAAPGAAAPHVAQHTAQQARQAQQAQQAHPVLLGPGLQVVLCGKDHKVD